MANWVPVGSVDDCPPGEFRAHAVGSEGIVLCNIDGDFYALEDRCTHENFPLSDGELDGDFGKSALGYWKANSVDPFPCPCAC